MESIRAVAQRVRESLFFVPTLMLVGGMVLARVTVWLDRESVDAIPLLLAVSPAGARTILTTVAGATVTVAAIVFSITALSSQITATQYSPRAVAGFFEDRFQQIVIGLVVGTFIYSLLVLAGLSSRADVDASEPSLSVTLTVVLGVTSIVAIVAYLDHSLRRMRIGVVVRSIADATVAAVRRSTQPPASVDILERRPEPAGEPTRIEAQRSGWVRAVDAERLVRSLPGSAIVSIDIRVGEAVGVGDAIATSWGSEADGGLHVAGQVRRAVHIGRDRTLNGDPAYGLRQLVDIGLRALSPGINDPTTASDVLQHLKLPIREILVLESPRRVFGGPEGQRVVLLDAPSRSDHVHAAFSELRLAASGHLSVLRTLIEVLSDLIVSLESADLSSRGGALREQLQLTVTLARESGFPESDLDRVLAPGRRVVTNQDDQPGEGDQASRSTSSS